MDSNKPIVAVMPAADGTGLIPAGMGLLPVAGPDGRPEHGSVPTFSNVEDAVHALALVRGYARWRDSEHVEVPEFPDVDPERAGELVAGWLAEAAQGLHRPLVRTPSEPGAMEPTAPGIDLTADQVAELLACYGIRVWPARPVHSEEEAVAAAEEPRLPGGAQDHRAVAGPPGGPRQRPAEPRVRARGARRVPVDGRPARRDGRPPARRAGDGPARGGHARGRGRRPAVRPGRAVRRRAESPPSCWGTTPTGSRR